MYYLSGAVFTWELEKKLWLVEVSFLYNFISLSIKCVPSWWKFIEKEMQECMLGPDNWKE